MNKIEFHSLEQQDEFIVNLFNQKKHGYFLDVACGHPILASNTYTLDKFLDWTGFCFDIGDARQMSHWTLQDGQQHYHWDTQRRSPFVQIDATSIEFVEFLRANIPSNTVVDYISLDVDGPFGNLAYVTLTKILEAGVKFKAMTFEHEFYIHGARIQQPARELLESLGYVRLFSDVNLSKDSNAPFEDWWIDPTYFSSEVLALQSSNLHFTDCVDKLRNLPGQIAYDAHHNCCHVFPNEVSKFNHQQEYLTLKEKWGI